MHNDNDSFAREEMLYDSIRELENINKKMAKMNVRKEELTRQIIGAFGHEHEGQKTYTFHEWKVEVKTPYIYSLDKKLYESGEFELPKEFNPVKQSVSYSVDKKLCEDYLIKAPLKVRRMLCQLIEKKPGKASVGVKAAI